MGTALFFAPHQDDELFYFSPDIIEHLFTDDVHVIVCMNGTRSFVRNALKNRNSNCDLHGDPKKHIYALTKSEFSKARDKEFSDSCKELGVPAANIHFYGSRAEDNKLDDTKLTIDTATNIIKSFLSKYPNAKIKTTTPDSVTPDHSILGQAALNLYKENLIPSKDVRFYISDFEIDEFKSNTKTKNVPYWQIQCRENLKYRISNATNIYKKWSPNSSPKNERVVSVTTDTLNIRIDPGTNHDIVTVAKKGDNFEYLGKISNGCYKVKTDEGKIGWCNADCLDKYLDCIGYSDQARYAIGYHSVSTYMDNFESKKISYCHNARDYIANVHEK